MKVRILGSCAGGGLPQWNCGGPNSIRARNDEPSVPSRTQPSIAVSAEGERWSVINASPDIRHQFAAFPGLHPRAGTRDVPLDTVVLTNADLDHCLGLLILREALSYRILTTPWVRDALLEHNAAFRLLEPAWGTVELDERIFLDAASRLEARFFPVPGKVPGFLTGAAGPNRPDTTVGVRITDVETGRRLVYLPGIKTLDSGTLAELRAADCRFLDGTFYTADELSELRPGAPDAFAMCHVPITGPGGSLEPLSELPGRSLYIHMNNTNPILDRDSAEAAAVTAAGIEIASDGLEFEL
jgi:pyrroloquinoline quinone biosynthesis protein B